MLVKRDDKKMQTNYIYYTIGTKTYLIELTLSVILVF